MLILKDWCLNENAAENICASGVIFGHHRVPDGTFIYTSATEKIYDYKDMYIMKTRSGSIYGLQKNDMLMYSEDANMAIMKDKVGIDHESDEQIEAWLKEAAKEREEKRKQHEETIAMLRQDLKDGEMYLAIDNLRVKIALFCDDGLTYEISPATFMGAQEESIWITDTKNKGVEFRYVPEDKAIRPILWSRGIDRIYIENISQEDFDFVREKGNTPCPSRKLVAIEK